MIWNQVQDLKGLKVYDVKKNCGGITSFLQRPLGCDGFSCFVLHDAPIDIRHLSYCLSFPRATSAISLSSLEQIREQSGSLSPTIQQHWQGDAAILWYWEHPWYAKCMNFKPEKPSEVPQVRETGLLALLPITLRPRAIVPLGVHRGAFGEQKLRSRDAAVGCRPVQRRRTSGGFPGAVGREAEAAETTKVVRMLSSVPVQPTNERWMFLDSTSSNLFKTKNNHKHTQQVSIHLVSDKLPSTKRCP